MPNLLKTAIKYTMRSLLGLLFLVIGYFLVGLLLSVVSTRPEDLHCEADREIFVLTNGIHLDIVFPKTLLGDAILQELEVEDRVKYLSFGWGDKGFYLETPTWEDLKFTTAAKALFLRSPTAMHVTHYYRAYEEWHRIPVCQLQLNLLIQYLKDSFERDAEGKVTEIKDAGYTSIDKFYEAKGSYSCLYTCNNWVNEGLKVAKIKTSLWSPFDYGVLYQVKKAN